jgi:hypothetical protein
MKSSPCVDESKEWVRKLEKIAQIFFLSSDRAAAADQGAGSFRNSMSWLWDQTEPAMNEWHMYTQPDSAFTAASTGKQAVVSEFLLLQIISLLLFLTSQPRPQQNGIYINCSLRLHSSLSSESSSKKKVTENKVQQRECRQIISELASAPTRISSLLTFCSSPSQVSQ